VLFGRAAVTTLGIVSADSASSPGIYAAANYNPYSYAPALARCSPPLARSWPAVDAAGA